MGDFCTVPCIPKGSIDCLFSFLIFVFRRVIHATLQENSPYQSESKNCAQEQNNYKKWELKPFYFNLSSTEPHITLLVCNLTHVIGSIKLSYWYLFCTHRSTFQSDCARPPRSVLKQVQKGTGYDQASSRSYQALKQRGEGHGTMVRQTWKTGHDPWLLRLLLRYLLRSFEQCEDPRLEKLFESNHSNSQNYRTYLISHGRPKWW